MSLRSLCRSWSDVEYDVFVNLINKYEVSKNIKGKHFAGAIRIFHGINKEMRKLGYSTKNDTQLFLKYKEFRAQRLRLYGLSYIDYHESSQDNRLVTYIGSSSDDNTATAEPSKHKVVRIQTDSINEYQNTDYNDRVNRSIKNNHNNKDQFEDFIDHKEKVINKHNYNTEVHKSYTIINSKNQYIGRHNQLFSDQSIKTIHLKNHERQEPEVKDSLMLTEQELANSTTSDSQLKLQRLEYVKKRIDNKVEEKFVLSDEKLERSNDSTPVKLKNTKIPIRIIKKVPDKSRPNSLRLPSYSSNTIDKAVIKYEPTSSASEQTFNITPDALIDLKEQILKELLEQLNECICPNCDATHMCICRNKRIPKYRYLHLSGRTTPFSNLTTSRIHFPYSLQSQRFVTLNFPKRVLPGKNYKYVKPSKPLLALTGTIDKVEPENQPLLIHKRIKTIPNYRSVNTNDKSQKLIVPHNENIYNKLIPTYRLLNVTISVDAEKQCIQPKSLGHRLVPTYRITYLINSVDKNNVDNISQLYQNKFKKSIPTYRLVNAVSMPVESENKQCICTQRKSLERTLVPAYRQIYLMDSVDKNNIDNSSKLYRNKFKNCIPTYRFLNMIISVPTDLKASPHSLTPTYRETYITSSIDKENDDILSNLINKDYLIPCYRLVNVTDSIDVNKPKKICHGSPKYRYSHLINTIQISDSLQYKFPQFYPRYRTVTTTMTIDSEKPSKINNLVAHYRFAIIQEHRDHMSLRPRRTIGNQFVSIARSIHAQPRKSLAQIRANSFLSRKYVRVRNTFRRGRKSVYNRFHDFPQNKRYIYIYNSIQSKRKSFLPVQGLQTNRSVRIYSNTHEPIESIETKFIWLAPKYRNLYMLTSIDPIRPTFLPQFIHEKLKDLIPTYRLVNFTSRIDSEERDLHPKLSKCLIPKYRNVFLTSFVDIKNDDEILSQNKCKDISNYRLVSTKYSIDSEKRADKPNLNTKLIPTYRLTYLNRSPHLINDEILSNIWQNKFKKLIPTYRLIQISSEIDSEKSDVQRRKLQLKLIPTYRLTYLNRSPHLENDEIFFNKWQNKFKTLIPTYRLIQISNVIDSEKLDVEHRKSKNKLIPTYRLTYLNRSTLTNSIVKEPSDLKTCLVPTYRDVHLTTPVNVQNVDILSKISQNILKDIPIYRFVNIKYSIISEKPAPYNLKNRLVPTYRDIHLTANVQNAEIISNISQNKIEDIPTYRFVNIKYSIISEKPSAVEPYDFKNKLVPTYRDIHLTVNVQNAEIISNISQNKIEDIPTYRFVNIKCTIESEKSAVKPNDLNNRLISTFRDIHLKSSTDAKNVEVLSNISQKKFSGCIPNYRLVELHYSVHSEKPAVYGNNLKNRLVPTYRDIYINTSINAKNADILSKISENSLIPNYRFVNLKVSIAPEKSSFGNKFKNLIPTYRSGHITKSINDEKPQSKHFQNKLRNLFSSYRFAHITNKYRKIQAKTMEKKLTPSHRFPRIAIKIDREKPTIKSRQNKLISLIPFFRFGHITNAIQPKELLVETEISEYKLKKLIPNNRLVKLSTKPIEPIRPQQSSKWQFIPSHRFVNATLSIDSSVQHKTQNRFNRCVPTKRSVNLRISIDLEEKSTKQKLIPKHRFLLMNNTVDLDKMVYKQNKLNNNLIPIYRFPTISTIDTDKRLLKNLPPKLKKLIPSYRFDNITASIDPEKPVSKSDTVLIPSYRFVNINSYIDLEKPIMESKFKKQISSHHQPQLIKSIDREKPQQSKNYLIPSHRFVCFIGSIDAVEPYQSIEQKTEKIERFVPTNRFVFLTNSINITGTNNYRDLIPSYRLVSTVCNIDTIKPIEKYKSAEDKFQKFVENYRFVFITKSIDTTEPSDNRYTIPSHRFASAISTIDTIKPIQKYESSGEKFQNCVQNYRFVFTTNSIDTTKPYGNRILIPSHRFASVICTIDTIKPIIIVKTEPEPHKLQRVNHTYRFVYYNISIDNQKYTDRVKYLRNKIPADRFVYINRSIDPEKPLYFSKSGEGKNQSRFVNVTTTIDVVKPNYQHKIFGRKLKTFIPNYRFVYITGLINLEKPSASRPTIEHKLEHSIPSDRWPRILTTVDLVKPTDNRKSLEIKLEKSIPTYRFIFATTSIDAEPLIKRKPTGSKLKYSNPTYRFVYVKILIDQEERPYYQKSVKLDKCIPSDRFPIIHTVDLEKKLIPTYRSNDIKNRKSFIDTIDNLIPDKRFVFFTTSIHGEKSTIVKKTGKKLIPNKRFVNITISIVHSEYLHMKREHLDPTYRFVFFNGSINPEKPIGLQKLQTQTLIPTYRFVQINNNTIMEKPLEKKISSLHQIPSERFINIITTIDVEEPQKDSVVPKLENVPSNRTVRIQSSIDVREPIIQPQTLEEKLEKVPSERFISVTSSFDAKSTQSEQKDKLRSFIPNNRFVNIVCTIKRLLPKKNDTLIPNYRFGYVTGSTNFHKSDRKSSLQNKLDPTYRTVQVSTEFHKEKMKQKFFKQTAIETYRFPELNCSIDPIKPIFEPKSFKDKMEISTTCSRFVNVNQSIDTEKLKVQRKLIPDYRFVSILNSVDLEEQPKLLENKKISSIPKNQFVSVSDSIDPQKRVGQPKSLQNKFPHNRFVYVTSSIDLDKRVDIREPLQDKIPSKRLIQAGDTIDPKKSSVQLIRKKKHPPIYRFVPISPSQLYRHQPVIEEKVQLTPSNRFVAVNDSVDPIKPVQKKETRPTKATSRFVDVAVPKTSSTRQSIKDKLKNVHPSYRFVPIMKSIYPRKSVHKAEHFFPTYRFVNIKESIDPQRPGAVQQHILENIPSNRGVQVHSSINIRQNIDQPNKMESITPNNRFVYINSSIHPEKPAVQSELQIKLKNNIPTYRFVAISPSMDRNILYDQFTIQNKIQLTPTYRFVDVGTKHYFYEGPPLKNKLKNTIPTNRFVPISKSIDKEKPPNQVMLIQEKLESLTPRNRFVNIKSIIPEKPEGQFEKLVPTYRLVNITETKGQEKYDLELNSYPNNLVPHFRFPYNQYREESIDDRSKLIKPKLENSVPSERFVRVHTNIDIVKPPDERRVLIPCVRFAQVTRTVDIDKPILMKPEPKMQHFNPRYRFSSITYSIDPDGLALYLQSFQSKFYTYFPAYRFLRMLTSIDPEKPSEHPSKIKKLPPCSVYVTGSIHPERVQQDVIQIKLQKFTPRHRFVTLTYSIDLEKPQAEPKKLEKFLTGYGFVQLKKSNYSEKANIHHKPEKLTPSYRFINVNNKGKRNVQHISIREKLQNLIPVRLLVQLTSSIDSKKLIIEPYQMNKLIPAYRFVYVNDSIDPSKPDFNLKYLRNEPSSRFAMVTVSENRIAEPKLSHEKLKANIPAYRFSRVNNLTNRDKRVSQVHFRNVVGSNRFVHAMTSIDPTEPVVERKLEKDIPTYRFVHVTLFIDPKKPVEHLPNQYDKLIPAYRHCGVTVSIDPEKSTFESLQKGTEPTNRFVHVTKSGNIDRSIVESKYFETKMKNLVPAYRFAYVTTSIDLWEPIPVKPSENKLQKNIPTYRFSNVTVSLIHEKVEKLTPTYRLISVTESVGLASPPFGPRSAQPKWKYCISTYRFVGISETKIPAIQPKPIEEKFKNDTPTYRFTYPSTSIDPEKPEITPNKPEKLIPTYRTVSISETIPEEKPTFEPKSIVPSFRFVNTVGSIDPVEPIIQPNEIENRFKSDIPTYRFINPTTSVDLEKPTYEQKNLQDKLEKLIPTYRLVNVTESNDKENPVIPKPNMEEPSYRFVSTIGSVDSKEPIVQTKYIENKLIPTNRFSHLTTSIDPEKPTYERKILEDKLEKLIPNYRLVSVAESIVETIEPKPVKEIIPSYRFVHTIGSVDPEEPIIQPNNLDIPTNRFTHVTTSVDPEKLPPDQQKYKENNFKTDIPTNRFTHVTTTVDPEKPAYEPKIKPKLEQVIPTYRLVNVPLTVNENKTAFGPKETIPSYRFVNTTGSVDPEEPDQSEYLEKQTKTDVPINRFTQPTTSIDPEKPNYEQKIFPNGKLQSNYRIVNVGETIDPKNPPLELKKKNQNCIPTYRISNITTSIDPNVQHQRQKNVPTYRFVRVNSAPPTSAAVPPFQDKKENKSPSYRFVPLKTVKREKSVNQDIFIKNVPSYRLVSLEENKNDIREVPSDKNTAFYRFIEISNSVDQTKPMIVPRGKMENDKPMYRFARVTKTIDTQRPLIKKSCCNNCQCSNNWQYYPP